VLGDVRTLGEVKLVQGDFRIDDWLIQPQINSVEKEGKTWHLEPKVMQVLVHLASHPNEVLSKDRLLEAVWHNTFVGDDVLVRCISEIRYVFGDDPKSSRVIQTIPKGGYRLIAAVTTEIQTNIELAKSLTAKPETVFRYAWRSSEWYAIQSSFLVNRWRHFACSSARLFGGNVRMEVDA